MINNSRAMVVVETSSIPDLVAEAFDRANSGMPFTTNSIGCRLEREIENVDPVAILTFGDEGLFRVSGERKSEAKAGLWMKVTHYRGDPLLVLPNFDPEFIETDSTLRQQSFFDKIVDDFVKVWQYGLTHTNEETWRYARP